MVGPFARLRKAASLGHVAKKAIGFCDQNVFQLFEIERVLIRWRHLIGRNSEPHPLRNVIATFATSVPPCGVIATVC